MTHRKNSSQRRADAIHRSIVNAGTAVQIEWLEGAYNSLNTVGIARALAKAFDNAAFAAIAEYKRSYAPVKRSKPALVDHLARHRINKVVG